MVGENRGWVECYDVPLSVEVSGDCSARVGSDTFEISVVILLEPHFDR